MQREIVIHRAVHSTKTDYTQVALIEDNQVVEIDMEPTAATVMRIGDIYYAKVVRVIASMQMAFVEIGEKRTALLHFSHAPQPVSVGESLLVQIAKLPRGEKGAVVSARVQLVGALLIYQPSKNSHGISISKRITDAAEQTRLQSIAERLVTAEAGLTVRSLAAGQPAQYLEAEWQRLQSEWQKVKTQVKNINRPQLVRAEWPLAFTYIRDRIANTPVIQVDNAEDQAALQNFMQTWLAPWVGSLQYQPGKHSLWYRYKIDERLQQAAEHTLSLPSGGFMVVEFTEAMITVDVNTGQYVKAAKEIDIVYQTNLEAARMLAQYLRLCNLAGIIVVDFIGMKALAQQQAVLAALQQALAQDSIYAAAYGFSALGLVEISRQRRGNTWLEYYK